MADLRIVDAPEIPTEDITGEEKLPTGGNGNYSISLDSLADYTKTKKDLADNTTVDGKVNGVRQELDAHIEDLLNPHQVTKGQIGLSNVDNTADADKPVSNSTQAAITSAVSPKADKTYVDNQLTLKADTTYVAKAIGAISTDASKQYAKLALANADIANINLNQNVFVSEAVNGGYWYKTTAGATSLTKSPYDPLRQAKDYADTNPAFKQQKIVVGNDFNTFLKRGAYYHWGVNLTAAQVPNAPFLISGNIPSGVLVVENPLDSATAGCTQTFYSMYDGRSPYFRKRKQDGTWPAVWDSLTLDSKKFNTIALTTGQDVLALGQGRYNTPTLTIGNSLINMPNAAYKFGVIEVDIVGGFKIVKFTPYGRDTSVYINASYEAGVWSGWQQYTPNTTGQINSLLKSLTKTDYFGKKYTNGELAGTAVYKWAYYVGLNSISGADGTSFNAVKARLYNLQGGEIQYRVYTGSAVSTGKFGYSVTAANQANYFLSGICKNFPSSDTGEAQTIELDKVVSIPPNTPFVIVFRRTDLRTFGIGHHTTVSGNLENRGFNLIASAVDWGVSDLANGSTPAFTQAGFQLLLNIETGGGSTPEPEVYTPELVLPPKIYAIPTYDCNIYLEHLTREDNTLYDYDITCAKGWHRKRGWWWKFGTGDVTAEYPLSVSVHDKQTGNSLASASSVVKCTALSANAGAKQVLTIGDSLLASGAITQQLLDMSVSDAMKVNLIGTRGTGLNKHEGRGGWTINDYTTAGRTYYQFTVSNVSELPAINATTYSFGGSVFMVQEVYISSGSGTINCNLVSGGAPTAGSSGVLTKTNASTGDASIAFSNVQPTAGNPFWDGSALNFSNYLSSNSLATPDVVFVQLGVNDTFGLTSDQAVIDFCATAFPKLDTLINSIKAVNSSIKVVVCAPPVYASQDAFGENYACGQTAWRAKRNIVTYNKALYTRYKNQEVSRTYVVGSGVAVDTLNNYPATYRPVNAFNTDTVYMQTNAVHPATSGYKQIGVSWFATAKALT